MATKPSNVYKCMQISYIIKIVFLVHVSFTFVAILREVHHKRWIYQDINIQYLEWPKYVGDILRLQDTFIHFL
jgi:hypothetical protein